MSFESRHGHLFVLFLALSPALVLFQNCGGGSAEETCFQASSQLKECQNIAAESSSSSQNGSIPASTNNDPANSGAFGDPGTSTQPPYVPPTPNPSPAPTPAPNPTPTPPPPPPPTTASCAGGYHFNKLSNPTYFYPGGHPEVPAALEVATQVGVQHLGQIGMAAYDGFQARAHGQVYAAVCNNPIKGVFTPTPNPVCKMMASDSGCSYYEQYGNVFHYYYRGSIKFQCQNGVWIYQSHDCHWNYEGPPPTGGSSA